MFSAGTAIFGGRCGVGHSPSDSVPTVWGLKRAGFYVGDFNTLKSVRLSEVDYDTTTFIF